MGNEPLEQPLVYALYYNGTMENVTSPTTELTFTAPSLPDGVFVDNITVTVTAINRFGPGAPSDPEKFEISRFITYMFVFTVKNVLFSMIYIYEAIMQSSMYVHYLGAVRTLDTYVISLNLF